MSTARNVVELLQALVAIPSVNPDGGGDPGTSQTGEGDCARYVAGFLRDCGAEVVLEDVEPGRPNVLGYFSPPGPPSAAGKRKPRILFAPHTDTVSVAGMTVSPFGGEVRNGKVWGRGTSDTKGTMAAMLWAFHELGEKITNLNATFGFVGLMGEEIGQPGSRHFARYHGEEWDFAIVGEPTELDVVCQHKGCTWLRLASGGRAVHGATPELGENAITAMLAVLEKIDTGFRSQLQAGEFHNQLLGSPTVNIGTIRGGSKTNIVPDSCEATLDIRETPELAAKGGAAELLRSYLKDQEHLPPVGIEILTECSALNTNVENPFVKQLRHLGAKPVAAPWFCDAAWLAAGGIPAVALGPGSIAQAHTEDEWIEVKALEEGVAFYRRIMEEVG